MSAINRKDATLPLTYEEALVEIQRLKNKLHATNEKWCIAVVKRTMDNRSHSKLTLAQNELRAAVIELCDNTSLLFDIREAAAVARLFRARWGIE